MPLASASDDKVPSTKTLLTVDTEQNRLGSRQAAVLAPRDELSRIFARISRRFAAAWETGWRWTTGDDSAIKSDKHTGIEEHRLHFTRGKSPRDTSACLSRFCAETNREDSSTTRRLCRCLPSELYPATFLFYFGPSAKIVYRWRRLPGELCSPRSWPNCGEIIPHSRTGIRSNQENA